MSRRVPSFTLALLSALLLLGAPALAYNIGDTVKAWEGVDSTGKTHRSADYAGKVVVLLMWDSRSPTCTGYAQRFEALAQSVRRRGGVFLGVAPNRSESAGGVQAARGEQRLSFPILVEKAGSIGQAFGARATPWAYVIDANGRLAYMGGMDDAPPPADSPKTRYLQDAVDAVLAGNAPARPKAPSKGAVRIDY